MSMRVWTFLGIAGTSHLLSGCTAYEGLHRSNDVWLCHVSFRSESGDLGITPLRSRGTPLAARVTSLPSLVGCELWKALSVEAPRFVWGTSLGPGAVLGTGVHKSHQTVHDLKMKMGR